MTCLQSPRSLFQPQWYDSTSCEWIKYWHTKMYQVSTLSAILASPKWEHLEAEKAQVEILNIRDKKHEWNPHQNLHQVATILEV